VAAVTRKGSMQLSIEAIIILVIAFVFLGLVIVFVKNFFGQAGTTSTQYLDQAGNPCNSANDDNPITPNKFQIKQGGSITEGICVLNSIKSPITGGILQREVCIDPDGTTISSPSSIIKFISGPLDIARGESKTYQTSIKVDPAAKLGVYICNVFVQKGSSDPKIGPIQLRVEVV
jgi:hypothetical protein